MKTLVMLTLLVGFTACGDDVKKRSKVVPPNTNNASNNSSNNVLTNNTTNNTTNNATNNATNNTNNATTNATNNTNNATNNTNNATNNTNNATNNTNNATNNTNNQTNNPAPCGPNPNFFGPIGSATTNPYNVDANLNAVLAVVPLNAYDPNVGGDDHRFTPSTPIPVNRAIVTATGYTGTRNFWIQDKNTPMEVFLPVDLSTPMMAGQIISFAASEIVNFEGHPEISAIQSLVIHSANNPVPYRQVTNRNVSMNDYGHIVKVGGKLLPNSYACGGLKTCYDLGYNGRVATLRSDSVLLSPGDCVTYVGPVRSFPGPHVLGPHAPQLDTYNYDWIYEKP